METVQTISNIIFPPLPSSPSILTSPSLPPFFAFQPNYLLIPLLLLLPLAYLTYKDYNSFLSLGPGGTPYNFYGYLIITSLRILALRNPRTPGPIPCEQQNGGYLPSLSLPRRKSPRPEVVGIAPHRQTNQRPRKEIFDLLSRSMVNLANEHPERLRIGTSCFEKHCPGLFSTKQVNMTCNGEIAHAHPSDGSLHMTLHPKDAKIIIEAGWGERHPLARGGWFTRFVPVGFLMIYAPRTEEEVNVVMNIISAGIGWVSGEPSGGSNTSDRSNANEGSTPVDCCSGGCCSGTAASTSRDGAGVVKDVANAVMEVA